ncbi:MAG: thiamine pyrophosphate-dependent enzyme [Candidatus Shapirobacteria bacterium]|nr:thiamine pyrophosphate-dependent enzyme [Candidatus Shapirobacteria bacterium]MDD4410799.1 thiamine pyrophosphate-dependent enzyme [Candidatus Shapirobacteria bacterium]
MINYRSKINPTWCPGCHNFLVFSAVQAAFNALELKPSDLVINYDIGCVGNMADFFKTYGVHTLHGRAIAVAMGEKMINPNLTVCVFGGDGGTYGEGLNHLIAAARANINITVFVSNNFLYSLTTGQTSPTTPKGSRTKSTPLGNPSEPVNIVELLKAVNPHVFVKSVDAKNIAEVTKNFKEALEFKGFALVETLQECVAFGKQLKS